MSRERRLRRALESAGTGTGPGVLSWWSRDRIERSHRRWRRAAVGLGLLAVLWIAALLDPDPGDNTMTGFIALELFTCVPLGYALFRLRRLGRMRRRASQGLAAQVADVAAQQDGHEVVHEALMRIGRIVDRLPPTVRDDAGAEAMRAASRTAAEWLRLLDRAADLRALRAGAGSPRTARSLDARIGSTEADADHLAASMDDLCVGLARLADASDDDDLAAISVDIDATEERMRLLADALAELRAEAPAGEGLRDASS